MKPKATAKPTSSTFRFVGFPSHFVVCKQQWVARWFLLCWFCLLRASKICQEQFILLPCQGLKKTRQPLLVGFKGRPAGKPQCEG